MIRDAEAEGKTAVAKYFGYVNKVEEIHASLYKKAMENPSKISNEDYYVCKICGYIYEGETLPDDFICPLCKHGAEDFEKL